MSNRTASALRWVEQGHVPDPLLRVGIRRLLKARLAELHEGDAAASAALAQAFADSLHEAPLALVPEKANEQHYELPAAFFAAVLGPHRKYSSAFWPAADSTLEEAEAAALAATCERAGIVDGQRILELGCGWGSLTLWMAARFPSSRITALSNSQSQRAHIEAEAKRRGLANIEVVTRDINAFDTAARFDRVVSVEMFEHLRNWPQAFARVRRLAGAARALLHARVRAPRGALRLRRARRERLDEPPLLFRRHDAERRSGAALPGRPAPPRMRWRWDGRHYQRTAEAWLANMDRERAALAPLFATVYGADAERWWVRWRLFFMSVAELFGHAEGQQWWRGHYLFERRP